MKEEYVAVYQWPNQKKANLDLLWELQVEIGETPSSASAFSIEIDKATRTLKNIVCTGCTRGFLEDLPELRGFLSDLRIPTHLWGVPLYQWRDARGFWNAGIPRYQEDQYNQFLKCVDRAVSHYSQIRDCYMSSECEPFNEFRVNFPEFEGQGIVGSIVIEASRAFFDMRVELSGRSKDSPGDLKSPRTVLYGAFATGIILEVKLNPPEKIKEKILRILEETILLVDPKDLDQWKKKNVAYGEDLVVSREELDLFEAMGAGHPILWGEDERQSFFQEKKALDGDLK